MEKLKFNFGVKSSTDGKTNMIAITSIGTIDDRNFIIPDELQSMNFHTEIAKTQAYTRIKNTLKRRHQNRSIWIALTKEIKTMYLDESDNLIFGDYYLEESAQKTEQKITETNTEMESMTNMLKKLIEEKNNKIPNLTKISEKFMIEKFSNRNTNANQWINDFENECTRFEINTDKQKIEIFKLFLEKSCVDWYSSMLIKLTIDSEWETWKTNFKETYTNKGWTSIRYAFAFKYQSGALLDYAVKKERLLLEVNKTIDKNTLINLIATGLPNYISDRIDKESLKKTEDLYNELGKLKHLVDRKKFSDKKLENNTTKYKAEKIPCKICEKRNKGKRYHSESACWFKTKDNEDKNDDKIKCINNSESESELIREDPKN